MRDKWEVKTLKKASVNDGKPYEWNKLQGASYMYPLSEFFRGKFALRTDFQGFFEKRRKTTCQDPMAIRFAWNAFLEAKSHRLTYEFHWNARLSVKIPLKYSVLFELRQYAILRFHNFKYHKKLHQRTFFNSTKMPK